jgi:anti-sigma factor RsiW
MGNELSTCSRPPALTDEALWAALDEVADASVVDHLAHCPYCAARLAALRRFGRALVSKLYRWGCPDVDTLGDYALGLLEGAAQRRVDDHLKTCVHCAGEVQALRSFLANEDAPAQRTRRAPADDVPRSLMRGITRVIATLMPLEPGLALRGSDETNRIMAATPHESVIIETLCRGDMCELTGQLIAGGEGAEGPAWQGALVEIYQDGRLAAAAVLDEMNEFTCAKLKPVTSRIVITSTGGRQIVIDGVRPVS